MKLACSPNEDFGRQNKRSVVFWFVWHSEVFARPPKSSFGEHTLNFVVACSHG